jgi:hypothetical protein
VLEGDLKKLDASIEETNAVYEANKAEWGWVMPILWHVIDSWPQCAKLFMLFRIGCICLSWYLCCNLSSHKPYMNIHPFLAAKNSTNLTTTLA